MGFQGDASDYKNLYKRGPLASASQLHSHLLAVEPVKLSNPCQGCGINPFGDMGQRTNERRGFCQSC